MTLFPLDQVRNAAIDRSLEPLLEQVRADLRAFPFDRNHDAGTAEEILEAFDMARPRLNVLASLARQAGGGRALDVSSGIGFVPVILRRLGLDVIATERDPSLARFARQSGTEVLRFEIGKDRLPLDTGTLDLLVLAEVLEHLKLPPSSTIRNLSAMLRPGGTLLLTTPNIARLAHIEALAAGENFLERFPEDLPTGADPTDYVEHVREYSVRELVEAVEEAGLGVEEVLMTGWGEAGYQLLPNPFVNEICVLRATR
jgi:2-polyprenyl-3-methyl-5-hydroxy-6-metoxy-1,4-benzoquinol methylase